eukprot:1150785-Prymnesium_polylepis.1
MKLIVPPVHRSGRCSQLCDDGCECCVLIRRRIFRKWSAGRFYVQLNLPDAAPAPASAVANVAPLLPAPVAPPVLPAPAESCAEPDPAMSDAHADAGGKTSAFVTVSSTESLGVPVDDESVADDEIEAKKDETQVQSAMQKALVEMAKDGNTLVKALALKRLKVKGNGSCWVYAILASAHLALLGGVLRRVEEDAL